MAEPATTPAGMERPIDRIKPLAGSGEPQGGLGGVEMTPRERLLAVLRRKVPDRVPVAPDESFMMPARYTGKPFWEVFVNEDPPLWRAKLDLQRRFGFDTILHSEGLSAGPGEPPSEKRILSRTEDRWQIETVIHTRRGDLTQRREVFRAQSPWASKPWVTDPEQEVPALLETLTDPWQKETQVAEEVRSTLGENGITASGIPVPLAWWLYQREDLSRSVLDFYDRRPLVEKAMAVYGEWGLEWVRACCVRVHPDLLMFGGSVASMSVVSPDLYRRYGLPWLCEAAAIARAHGVFSGVHMCGRSKAALPMLADSGIDLLEPLESPPGGNVSLADVKRQYGDRLILKGNVNTFQTLAHGSPEDVLREARRCIEDAGEGGGFVLSSGDQVPGDTPEANFEALIRAPRLYGLYDAKGSVRAHGEANCD